VAKISISSLGSDKVIDEPFNIGRVPGSGISAFKV
jgi:hypothetical protein